MITYAYARVSTKEQNLERQIIAIKNYKHDIADTNIFTDKQTGKDFDRPQYQAMKIILEHLSKSSEAIEVVFEELDRLGRNAKAVKCELEWYKEHNIYVRILEIPTTLIEANTENQWVMTLINQILIEVYSAMAEQELEKRAKRQAEGIAVALESGVHFGRKPIEIDKGLFETVYKKWKANEITATAAMNELSLKPNTFYRRVKVHELSDNVL